MKFIKNYKLQEPLFYCTTLLYFLFIGGFFRLWFPQAAPQSRFAVALSVLAFLVLLYWFFERIMRGQSVDALYKKILLLYWVAFWFFLFFVSRSWLSLFLTLGWLFILWWQVKSQWGSLVFRINALIATVVVLITIDLYSFATFFNFPVLILAVFGGVLFAGIWLLETKKPDLSQETPNLPALLATVFLGVEAVWLSRFFPWSITAMTAFFLSLLGWLAVTRFLGRWSWFASGCCLVFLGLLLIGLRWS